MSGAEEWIRKARATTGSTDPRDEFPDPMVRYREVFWSEEFPESSRALREAVDVGFPDSCWLVKRAFSRKEYPRIHLPRSEWGKWIAALDRDDSRIGFHIACMMVIEGRFLSPRDDEIVLHRCDQHGCGNPTHYRIGTYKENVEDMLNRQRGRMLSVTATREARRWVREGLRRRPTKEDMVAYGAELDPPRLGWSIRQAIGGLKGYGQGDYMEDSYPWAEFCSRTTKATVAEAAQVCAAVRAGGVRLSVKELTKMGRALGRPCTFEVAYAIVTGEGVYGRGEYAQWSYPYDEIPPGVGVRRFSDLLRAAAALSKRTGAPSKAEFKAAGLSLTPPIRSTRRIKYRHPPYHHPAYDEAREAFWRADPDLFSTSRAGWKRMS